MPQPTETPAAKIQTALEWLGIDNGDQDRWMRATASQVGHARRLLNEAMKDTSRLHEEHAAAHQALEWLSSQSGLSDKVQRVIMQALVGRFTQETE